MSRDLSTLHAREMTEDEYQKRREQFRRGVVRDDDAAKTRRALAAEHIAALTDEDRVALAFERGIAIDIGS